MDDQEVLKSARNLYIQQFRGKADELRPLIQRIRSLDQDIGDATDLNQILSEIAALTTATGNAIIGAAGTGDSARPKVRPDEFMGDTYIEAAKKYLERVGHAVSMEELLEVLKSGGCPVGGKTPKKTLYISLVRSRDFVPIPGRKKREFLGLRKFYSKQGSK
jgi:hypothetical protein